jgi:hypothetical protein
MTGFIKDGGGVLFVTFCRMLKQGGTKSEDDHVLSWIG